MINLAVGEDLLITLVKLIYDRMSNKFREIFDQLDWHFEAWGVSINKNSKNAIEKTDLRIVLEKVPIKDIMTKMDKPKNYISIYRRRLIDDQVIFSKERGYVEFTLPYFADFVAEFGNMY